MPLWIKLLFSLNECTGLFAQFEVPLSFVNFLHKSASFSSMIFPIGVYVPVNCEATCEASFPQAVM